ncbi:GNAT family N-acetyltransferase [Streptomyces sp. 3R004]|nr:GNAT family N-acetyltransferase [Streptomyces justiciae]
MVRGHRTGVGRRPAGQPRQTRGLSGNTLADPEVVRFTGGPDAEFTLEHLRSWYGSRSAQPDRLDLAVTDRATGELVGEVVLYEWDARARCCTFRTLLGPRGRDRGLGTEATRLVVGYGFEELGLHRV